MQDAFGVEREDVSKAEKKSVFEKHPVGSGVGTAAAALGAGGATAAGVDAGMNRMMTGKWKGSGKAAARGAKLALKSKQNLAIAGLGGAAVTGINYAGRKKP
jgi:hypothetical protein